MLLILVAAPQDLFEFSASRAPGFQTMLNPTIIYTLKKGCENRIFGFPQKYVKTTQDSTQMTFGCQI